jgi:hypothetical protein
LTLSSPLIAFGQISDRTGLKNNFVIEAGGYEFEVPIVANFDVNQIDFSEEDKKITLHLNSQLEKNLAEIQIPRLLINGNFTFFLNDQEIFPDVKKNDKISFITFRFDGSGMHKLEIIGTTYLPEFSEFTPLILLLSLSAILIVFMVKKKNLPLIH